MAKENARQIGFFSKLKILYIKWYKEEKFNLQRLKVFANNIAGNDLVYRIYKELLKLNNKIDKHSNLNII